MRLIVGLGNPGNSYEATRHNLGFQVVDELLESSFSDASKKNQFNTDLFATRHGQETVLLAKPQTMMNLSGEAVSQLVHFYKVALDDLWVVYDDVDLAFGELRVRRGGSSGGHNGVKSIIERVGEEFWRFRIGIANEHLAATPTDRFVLSHFEATEREAIPKIITSTAKVIVSSLSEANPKDTTYTLTK